MSFGGLYISISGIDANKKALDTVSHNISNVNNPHYTRQSAVHATNRYVKIGEGLEKGTGVHVEEIRQTRDKFLDFRYRYELEKYGYWNATSDILGEVEIIFNEVTNSGLQKVMEGFWNSWEEVYKTPDSLTMRGLLHESGVAFTETVNHIDTQLDNLQLNLNKEIKNEIEEINNILDEIASLNDKIKLVEGETSKVKANDYRDRRNELLDRLAGMIPIECYEKPTNEIVVSLQGRDLVNGGYINHIGMTTDRPDGVMEDKPNKGYAYICWSDTGEHIELGEKGSLFGYIHARDEIVEKYRDDLDTLVENIANEINELHKDGYNLEGEKLGQPFFVGDEETIKASNIKVNPDLANFNKIAISKSGDKGDGEIAKEILKLREEKFLDDMTFEEYYRDLVSNIAVERKTARNIADNQGKLLKQIDERRQTISGVSLDEEMTNMLRYQHSYVANSRVVNAIDEMIDTIVNRMAR